MYTYNMQYTTFEEFKNFLNMHRIHDNDKLFIQIFTSILEKNRIKSLLNDITYLLPSAAIIGATSDGEICGSNVTTDQTIVSISQFNATTVKTALIDHGKDAVDTGTKLANNLAGKEAKVIIALTNGLNCNAEEFLKGIYAVNDKVKVAGGMAADHGQFKCTYIFTKETISSKGAVGVALYNKDLEVSTAYTFNWLGVGKNMTITSVDKNRVYTIDNIPAYKIYKKYLGADTAKELPEIGLEYPLIINRNNEMIARAVLHKHSDNSLTFAGNFQVGDIVQFGYGDAEAILQHSARSFKKIYKKPVETIFIYSCTARRRFMPDEIYKEIEPFSDLADTCGFFTYGEFFSTKQRNELLNQTMTVLALSESKEIRRKNVEIHHNHTQFSKHQKSIRALSHLLNTTITELNQDKQQLQAKKESLNLAQSIGHFGSWEINMETGVATWSAETYRIYRQDPDTYTPTLDKFIEKVIEKDRPKIKRAIRELYQESNIKSVEVQTRRSDGTIINILINGKMVFDQDGTPTKMVGTTLDVTDLVQAKKMQQQQSEILAQIHDSIITVDINEIITYCNHAATIASGYTKEELIGQHIKMLYPEKEYKELQKLKPYLLTHSVLHRRVEKITKSGEIRYADVSFSLLRNENGIPAGITAYSRDITQQKKLEDQLSKQATQLNFQAFHDDLTKLPNRALFHDRLQQSLNDLKRGASAFALLFIDLDNFKQINDSLGHNIGDKVLKTVAQRLQTCTREQDTLSRLGGDEFTILLKNIKTAESAANVAQKIIDITKRKIVIDNHELYISTSIGISLAPQDSNNKNDLIKYADSAMYTAKEKGRDNYKFYSTNMTESAFEKIIMETSLRIAIQQNQFVVYYQPQVNAVKKTIVGMEALVRWQHPTMGLISPDQFIPLAEELGFIIKLDNFVMKQAMLDFVQWYKKGLAPGILSLNLSIIQLNSDEFIEYLNGILQETGFHVNWLELEITETQIMQNPTNSIKKLKTLNDMGIKIAIDDFGTGYSSLAYLKRLPVSQLKIDKSFVDNLPSDEEDCAISKTIIALAQSLNLGVIAEGVETKEQLNFLVANSCNYIQGYYYSPPLCAKEAELFIRKPLR